MYRYYRLINSLSIDVAIGAVVSAVFFAHVLGETVPMVVLACLGLTVWLIYTADHLLDVYALKTEASTTRHRLHQLHFKSITAVFLLFFILNLGVIFFLPAEIIFYGGVLAVFVLVYFLIQKRLSFLKEISGAALYTMGVALPATVTSHFEMSGQFLALAGLFFAIALLNLMLYSWFDVSHDHFHKYRSFVTTVGKSIARKFIVMLFAVGSLSLVLVWWFGILSAAQIIIYGGMLLTLLWILMREKRLCDGDRYRMLGDLIFLYPLLVFIL